MARTPQSTPHERELRMGQAGFPAELTRIPSPASSIHVRGRIPPAPRIALVGARKADSYGLELARQLGRDLARARVAVVSGGAAGIDTAALEGCLDAGGQAVAVLGTGLDVVYPAANAGLFTRVAEAGALLSEYPRGTQGRRGNFPKRNRLVSALSEGVVVVRAALGSGSLITADLATRQGRVVMAVPGAVGDPLSAGTHQLLRRGARLVESVEDVLSAAGIDEGGQTSLLAKGVVSEAPEPPADLDADERLVFEALMPGTNPIDVLIDRTGLDAGRVSGLLLGLELKGLVAQLPGMMYRRIS